MADLESVIGQIPFLGGWEASRQQNEARQRAELGQATSLMALLQHAQALQEAQRSIAAREAFGTEASAMSPTASMQDRLNLALRYAREPKDVATIAEHAQSHAANQQMALFRLQRDYEMKNAQLDVARRHATTDEQKTQIKNAQLSLAQQKAVQEAAIKSGRTLYETGIDVPVPDFSQAAFPTVSPQPALTVGIPAAAGAPISPSAATAAVPTSTTAPSPVLSGSKPLDFPVESPTERAIAAQGQLRILEQEAAQNPQAASDPAFIREHARVAALAGAPAPANNLDVRDVLAQRAVPAPKSAAIPDMPPEIAARPKALQDKWLLQHTKPGAPITLQGQDLVSAGAQIASGMPITQVVPGFGQAFAADRQAARSEAIRQIKARNPGMTDEQAGEELVNRNIDFVAGRRSITQLNTMLGATRQSIDQLEFNVRKSTEEMDKLGGQGITDLSPVINAIARGAQKWTGDPAYSALFYYMFATGTESARILSGGQASIAQLYEGARKDAQQWASANMTTPKAWKEGVAPAILAEGHERIRTYERAIERQRLGRTDQNVQGAPSTVAPSAKPFSDPEKERRYQEWKAQQK